MCKLDARNTAAPISTETMSIQPFIGTRISIITHRELRYEGLLYDLNSDEGIVVLQHVYCMGTENRWADQPVPPSRRVQDFVIFKGDEIKDLSVCEPGKDDDLHHGAFDNPDILGAYHDRTFELPGGLSHSRVHGIERTHAKHPDMMPIGKHIIDGSSSGIQMADSEMLELDPLRIVAPHIKERLQEGYDKFDVAMPPHSLSKPFYSNGIHPDGTDALGEHMTNGAVARMPKCDISTMYSDMSPHMESDSDTGKHDLVEFDFGPDPFAESTAPKLEENKKTLSLFQKTTLCEQKDLKLPQPKQKAANKPRGDKTTKAPSVKSSYIAQSGKSHTSESQNKTQRQKTYDLQSNITTTANVVKESRPFYDKRSSFFDNLSSDTQGSRRNMREERQRERAINVDTFGEDTVRRPRHNRGRGNGDRRRPGQWNHGGKKSDVASDAAVRGTKHKGSEKTAMTVADLESGPATLTK
ncbi:Protein LSM14 -like protein [Babesia sp. Xinjiang]|uniref:Protein LSM14 -like protein n=1 Tax=Babesia sp. Xinjiang TaxID=462227 RepID=UPI000A26679D|nr:Protein LSM14 -like protein [Babesia sp. Xinjiang]ORM40079.1 Protein LSM14 -like protein [Babesia sp. Xinjiang]